MLSIYYCQAITNNKGVNVEKYFEINKDKLNIKCKIYCNDLKNVSNVMVSCHGFGGNKDNAAFRKMAEKVLGKRKDFLVITFDWPCHGDDVRQKLCLADCDDYLSHVLDHVMQDYKPENLFANATSFGGYLTLKYIREHGNPFRRITLRCPAVKMNHVLFDNILTDEDRKVLRKGKPAISGFEKKIKITPEFIKELNENDITKLDYREFSESILILQGTNDELVSFETVRDFAKANSIGFIQVDGADHRFKDPAKLADAINRMEAFMLEANI